MRRITWLIMAGALSAFLTASVRAESQGGASQVPEQTTEENRPQKNYDKPGFVTMLDKDGRLWVFRADSRELAEFREKGEPVKVVVRPRKGPDGLTLKSTDVETIEAYLAAP